MKDFGKNFRKLRESAGLSQEALAASLKISTSVVNRIENNKRKLDIDLIYRLQTVLSLGLCPMVSAIFEDDFGSPDAKLSDLHFSRHYEKIIEEKNQIIQEKNRYIDLLERK